MFLLSESLAGRAVCVLGGDRGLDRVVTWLALSGMASLIYKLTTKGGAALAGAAEGQDHGMLRTDASSADTEDHYQ